MTTKNIRSAPSGPRVDVLVPPDVANPDPALFLNEAGDYVAPAGSGNVDSVQGSNGIKPTTAQTGAVTLDGEDLLPRDGSRAMTGALDMGAQDIANAGSVAATDVNGAAITSGGVATNYLDETGAYSVPPGGGGGAVDSVQGSDGITPTGAQTGIVNLSGDALLPRDGSRPMTSPGTLLGTCNGVTLSTGGAATSYLDETGAYSVPAGGGGAVASVQGTGGIAPTTPQTGIITLDGDLLLPRDGSRAMTGGLNMGAQVITNAASVNGAAITSGGAATNYLDETGAYSVPAGGGGGGGPNFVNTFDVALGEDSQTITNQDMPTCFAFCGSDVTVTRMFCWIAQTGAAGDVIMAIYDTAGVRQAITVTGNASVDGVLELALQVNFNMVAGEGYYLALYANANASQYMRIINRYNGAGPIIAPRPTSVAPGPPANINTGTNGETSRFWVSASA